MIVSFTEVSADEAGLVGGKGLSLSRLFQAGYPVPEGFVITTDSFDHSGLKPSFLDEALAAFRALSAEGPVAVRSSAVAEDSSFASFAGGFDSVLNVRDEAAFRVAVQKVFDSASSERIRSYSQQIDHDGEHRIAVVVQKMIDADLAGVLFTIEPVSQNQALMSGNFVTGLGERLVSGEVTPETFTIERSGLIYHGPARLRDASSRLAQLALEIERDFGAPQDIEWAVKNGEVSILQSRDITTLSEDETWNSSLGQDCLWTNTNVGEALPGVMTPYTWSLIQRTFDHFYEPPAPHSMLGNIGGRVYINLSLLLGIVRCVGLPPRKTMELMAVGLGNVPAEMSMPVLRVPWLSGIGTLWVAVKKAVIGALTKRKYLNWAQQDALRECDEKLARIASLNSREEAIALGEAFDDLGDHHFQMLLRVTSDFLVKRSLLKSMLTKHLDQDDVETLVSGLGGDSVLQSMGPMVAIEKVSRGELAREEFIRTYGHRGPNEVELSKPRTAEDPAWIDKLIEGSREMDIWPLLDRQEQARQAAWARLAAAVGRWRYRRIRAMASASAEAARNRETVRSELVRFMNVPRQLALKIGTMTGLGDDIFYLEQQEILDLLRGNSKPADRIPARKRAMARYEKMPPPPNFISGPIDLETWADNPNRRTDFHDALGGLTQRNDATVSGFPGAAGIVEGVVRVLADHNEGHLLQPGEILVASFTNVGWTPIFPKALAVITDIGAPLSHAAIVARELGIPAVVGTGNATMILRTGDRVRVNGGAGTVTPLQG